MTDIFPDDPRQSAASLAGPARTSSIPGEIDLASVDTTVLKLARGNLVPKPTFGAYDPKRISQRPALTYASLDLAYDFFNRQLFDGNLPRCLITMQRGRSYYGYFSGDRFVNLNNPADVTDEIALNPIHFRQQTAAGVLSTLAHEMAHLWQHHFGRPSRGRYHNKEWAAKMIQIGLIPSSTGEPGGKQTGDHVSHYVLTGGRFDRASAAYIASDTTVLYQDSAYGERSDDECTRRERLRKAASKTRYTCRCPQIAWAKPGARFICEDCNERMAAGGAEPQESETDRGIIATPQHGRQS